MKVIFDDGTISYYGTLEENKKEALYLISNNFLDLAKTNRFLSSFGFFVDNRWVEKNDIDNITDLIDVGFEEHNSISFRDANNNHHELTKDQLIQLKKEAQKNKLTCFRLKWMRSSLINLATTVERVWDIFEKTDEQIIEEYNNLP